MIEFINNINFSKLHKNFPQLFLLNNNMIPSFFISNFYQMGFEHVMTLLRSFDFLTIFDEKAKHQILRYDIANP